ncbi:MAG: HAD-IA family hydrolase, partial [Eubacteriales bacterium]
VYEKLVEVTVKHPTWNELDLGVMTTEEVVDAFVKLAPEIETEIRHVFENVTGIVAKADYAIPWIKELKEKGYQVLVLSNFSDKVLKDCQDALGFLECIDGGILSFQDKVIKPMPEIYELILKRYQLVAEECVFLDDMQQNIQAAARFGIHAILFTEQEKAVKELETLGVV